MKLKTCGGAKNADGFSGQSCVELGHFNISDIVFLNITLLYSQKADLRKQCVAGDHFTKSTKTQQKHHQRTQTACVGLWREYSPFQNLFI